MSYCNNYKTEKLCNNFSVIMICFVKMYVQGITWANKQSFLSVQNWALYMKTPIPFTFVWLTVTCSSTTHTQHIVTFPQQWLCKGTATLHYTYTAHLVSFSWRTDYIWAYSVYVKFATYSLKISRHHIRNNHDKWVPVTKAWHVFRWQLEEQPQIWNVAANMLNKQSQTATKGWSSSMRNEWGANNSSL